jgi:hypothetical protein
MKSRARKKQAEMNDNSLGVVLSSGGLAAAERSEGSPPGEPQRSGAAAKAGADSGTASRPDPGVVAKAKRRTYTADINNAFSRKPMPLQRHVVLSVLFFAVKVCTSRC